MKKFLLLPCLLVTLYASAQQKPKTPPKVEVTKFHPPVITRNAERQKIKTPPKVEITRFTPPVIVPDADIRKNHPKKFKVKPVPKVVKQEFKAG